MTPGKQCIFFYTQTWQSTERQAHQTERVLRDAVPTYPTSCDPLKTLGFLSVFNQEALSESLC